MGFDRHVAREWLELVHPGFGVVGICAFPRTQRPGATASNGGVVNYGIDLGLEPEDNKWETTLDKIEELELSSWKLRDRSVRVRLSSYYAATGAPNGRLNDWKKHRIQSVRTWMLDIDVHDPAKERELPILLKSVLDQYRKNGFPDPTFVMASGWGVHLLWCSAEILGMDEWTNVAERLKAVAQHYHLPVDLQPITDPSRSLRPPGTTNWRDPATPRKVVIIAKNDLVEFERMLPPIKGPGRLAHLGQLDPVPRKPLPPWRMEDVAKKCAVLDWVRSTAGANCSEPQWRSVLQLCAFAEDGRHMAHELSKGYPSYNFYATERKFDDVKSQIDKDVSIGPHTCKWLQSQFGDGRCVGCKYSSRIRTPAEIESFETAVPSSKFTSVDKPVPGSNLEFGLYELLPEEVLAEDGSSKTVLAWHRVAPYVLEDITSDEWIGAAGLETFVKFKVRHKEGRSFPATIDMAKVYDARSMKQTLAKVGMDQADDPQSFFRFLQEIRTNLGSTVAKAYRHLGIHPSLDDRHGRDRYEFVHGATVYLPGGGTREVGQWPVEYSELASAFTTTGSRELWRSTLDKVCDDPRPTVHAVLGISAGAPFVKFTQFDSLVCVLWSPNTGVGKTTLLKVAQSLWGSRERIGSSEDTQASLSRKLGILHSLPAFADEHRALSKLNESMGQIFALERGTERLKCTKDSNLREQMRWRNVIMFASNFSLLDRMARSSHGAPGVARVIQLYLDSKTSGCPDINYNDMSALDNNYGWAAETVGRAIADKPGQYHTEQIGALYQKIFDALSKDKDTASAANDNSLRFLIALAAVSLYGGQLLKDGGDMPRWNPGLALQAFVRAAKGMATTLRGLHFDLSPIQVLANYVSSNRHRMLTRPSSMTQPLILPVQRNVMLVGELDYSTGRVRLVSRLVREWMEGMNIDHLPQSKSIFKSYEKDDNFSIGKGVAGYTLPPQKYLDVPLRDLGMEEEG